ncbi:hypothetical protein, partial [Shewanella algae]|uniref:hypothetical protein n=1 Tax=Shewanella algae TaxID=38313 RepID=UPI00300613F4
FFESIFACACAQRGIVVLRWPFSVLGEWWVCLAIELIAQTGLSSLPVIYYLEQLFSLSHFIVFDHSREVFGALIGAILFQNHIR